MESNRSNKMKSLTEIKKRLAIIKEEERCGFNFFWKVLIIIMFIILICLTVIYLSPRYNYRTEYFILDNDNRFVNNVKVVDYLCDNGIVFNKHFDSYYASSWDDANIHYGQCIIKIKEVSK
jgi:hypothetical protein